MHIHHNSQTQMPENIVSVNAYYSVPGGVSLAVAGPQHGWESGQGEARELVPQLRQGREGGDQRGRGVAARATASAAGTAGTAADATAFNAAWKCRA